MKKSRIGRSLFRRSFIQLTVTLALIFSVFGLSYLLIFNRLSKQQLELQLSKTAQAVADEYNRDPYLIEDEARNAELLRLASFSARSTNSIIWLINPHHEIIYATALPKKTMEIFESGRQGLILPLEFRNHSGLGISYEQQFAHCLSEENNWYSYSEPIENELGSYLGEVIIHKHLSPEELPGAHLIQTLIISLGIAIIFATLATLLLAKKLSQPIAALAQTADAVYRGDLSARVYGFEGKPGDDLAVLAQTMNSMIASLAEEEAERRSFLASISHDLRTPLTSIKGFVNGLLDGTIPEDRAAHYLNLVAEETRRMQSLVQALMDSSFAEAMANIEPRTYDINEQIMRVLRLLEQEFRNCDLNVSYELFYADENGECQVVADPQLIHRVLTNLLTNAIRFTPKGGQILISTKLGDSPGKLEITVADSGEGVAKAEQEAIFKRFYKVDKSRGGDGSGLGLYIARQIISAHGEHLQYIETTLGGAAFSFELALGAE
ncbi:MAG: HAMP domain-containing sensor histidine kinase [Eubacteriales bacterium]|nr:HAMP domain-containing sensor histidine kinase [Eubacteriales bacterium]